MRTFDVLLMLKCINAFPTGLLFNSPEGPSHELDLEPIGSGTWIFIFAHLRKNIGGCLGNLSEGTNLAFVTIL